MTDHEELVSLAQRARAASRALLRYSTQEKDAALRAVYQELLDNKEGILRANVQDLDAANHADDVSPALAKRLDLSGQKFDQMVESVKSVVDLEDPVGKVSLHRELAPGLILSRLACPIGVICIIFEARPEAAVQISSLAIKSANAVILKGGKEARQSNQAIANAIRSGLEKSNFERDCVQIVKTRAEIDELLKLSNLIDLVIPRGSNALVRHITDNTRIPVLGHADGICSVYVDKDADLSKAMALVLDSKTQYPAVCNAAENLIIHRDCLTTMLPSLGRALAEADVHMFADTDCLDHLPKCHASPMNVDDFSTEYLDNRITVVAVPSLDDAIDLINSKGSHHTDMIVTESKESANRFLTSVDSAGVFHNASTRFADGYRYGFGAEVGVSTTRTHSRGPVGMEGLLIYKYHLVGDGHTVAPFVSRQAQFTHKDLDK